MEIFKSLPECIFLMETANKFRSVPLPVVCCSHHPTPLAWIKAWIVLGWDLKPRNAATLWRLSQSDQVVFHEGNERLDRSACNMHSGTRVLVLVYQHPS